VIFLAVLLLQITHAAQDNSSIVIAVRMLNGVGMTASDAEPDAEPESEPNAECHALTELQNDRRRAYSHKWVRLHCTLCGGQ